MTEYEAKKRLKKIKEIQHDDEAAHFHEDEFHLDVLKAIAKGECKGARLVASIACRTEKIDFSRWYA